MENSFRFPVFSIQKKSEMLLLKTENCKLKTVFIHLPLSLTVQHFACAYVVPSIQRGERLVIRHVAAQRCDGDIALLYGAVIRAVLRARIEILFADPEIWFAARVYMLCNYRTRVFDTLPCNAHSFNFAGRNIYVQKSPV